MLTGGIDLSVGMVASMAAFIMATQTGSQGPAIAISLAIVAATVAGMANGIGVGVFKVHPLIMTLGVGLVILGLMNVYQLMVVQAGTTIPPIVEWLGSGTTLPFLPNNVLVFIPLAALIIAGLRYSGFGRLLFAVGDNPVAARLAGVRLWQVLLALYVLSALLAAVAGILVAGLVKTASLALVEQSVLPAVAAAVIGGTSIMGGRGGYSGTIIGALILTVLTSLLIALQMPEAVRQILFGAIIVAVAAAYTRVTGDS
jgi:ribose transport system permease protein